MAAPTVSYFAATAGTGAAAVSAWMPKLQELMLAAGWTLEYADSDAIGGGSEGTPAWDKTPANTTDAGTAVYRMPANDHATQWYVRVRPGWGSSSAPYMRGLQVGASHDGNGNLSGGSTEMEPATSVNASAQPWAVAVSEDGFALIIGANINYPHFCVERARASTGAVSDDVVAWNKFSSTASGLEARHVNAAVGQVSNAPPLCLLPSLVGGVSGVNNPAIPSLESGDASQVAVIGPYFVGGDPLFAPPRLAFIASPEDVTVNSDRELTIDGSSRTYRAMPGAVEDYAGIWLVATE